MKILSSTTVFKVYKNKKCFLSSNSAYLISEGSYDTEEKFALPSLKK